ncbi:TadE/TadG family type IV pilus assembly protein [Kitasatospora sp. NPDC058965]|uniref:TadE/TadG family type IV pilus assembly protein n=1 Tax=Kitasatospora sp. NPDC058965 TaxID=3346682 RepID=UPI003682DFF3
MGFHRGGRERGTISIFVAISASFLMVFVGIVLDAGGQLRTMELADALAQEAARAGGQQIDQDSLLSGSGYKIDHVAGCAAARQYLVTDPRLKDVNLQFSCPDLPPGQADRISVSITLDYRTSLLSLFHVNTLSVSGAGTARLAPDPTKPGGP